MTRDVSGDAASPLPDFDTRREPSLHQLRLFLVLADERHFGRAAERLFMTQPAFSQQIRALEGRLGIQLIDRTIRSVELTAAGGALLPQARAAVEAMAHLRRLADIHTREVRGHLVIGCIGAEAAMPYTRAVLGELRSRHPRITVEVRSLDFIEQDQALARGEVDAAFLRPPVPAGTRSLQLATEPRVVCLPADDPLASQPGLTLADLAHRRVVDVPPDVSRAWWDHWVVNPRPDGTEVRFGPVVADIEALLLAVASEEAIAFLPAAARVFYPRPGVAYAEVADVPPSTAALVWPAKNHDRPTVTALRQAAAHVATRAAGPSASAGAEGFLPTGPL